MRRSRMNLRLRQLLRAVCARCPLCGTHWPRAGMLGLAARCPTCDVHLERRESDYFLGSYTLNLGATLFVAVLLAVANLRWGGVAAPVRYGLGILILFAFAIAFRPLSKLLWLAVDLQFRTPSERDFDADQE